MYPRLTNAHKASPSEEIFDLLGAEEARGSNDEEPAPVAGTSNSSSTLGADEGFADGDDDTQDSIVVNPPNASTSKSNGFSLPSLFESDDSELEIYLDDILERGKSIMKKGGTIPKYPSSSSSWYLLIYYYFLNTLLQLIAFSWRKGRIFCFFFDNLNLIYC